MKMKNNILTIIALLFVAGIIVTGCDKELDRPPITNVDPNKILEIKDLYQIQADSGDNYLFADDYMLYATVVMDDSKGNIYKEAYLQDTTGGINLYKLSFAGALKVGQYVRINLNGAKLLEYNGKMELSFVDVLDFGMSMVIQKSNAPIEPVEVTVADLYSGEYLCELVTLKDVEVVAADTSKTWANRLGTSAANIKLEGCDIPANTVVVRTSDYSDFAGDSVPKGKGNITGIATKYQYPGGSPTWQILIRTPDEVNLDGPRCGVTE